MRIFVTGASGWIGSAVVPELLGAGHEVVGLARSEASRTGWKRPAPWCSAASSTTPTGLAKAANDADGVVHLAFQHEVAFGGNFAAAGPPTAGRRGHGRGPGRLRPPFVLARAWPE